MKEDLKRQMKKMINDIEYSDLDDVQLLISQKRAEFTKIDSCITELFSCLKELADLGVKMRIDPNVYLHWDSDHDFLKDVTIEYLTQDKILLIK